MLYRVVAFLLVLTPAILYAQATPDECFGFRFGAWDPPLKSVASRYNPGYDPTASAPAGSPRDWASRVPNGRPSDAAADSVLLLFPAWWPSGVAITWLEQRGDTLLGRATALLADGRIKNPVSAVRGIRVTCGRPETTGRDTSVARGS
jgi:hypothetical protein